MNTLPDKCYIFRRGIMLLSSLLLLASCQTSASPPEVVFNTEPVRIATHQSGIIPYIEGVGNAAALSDGKIYTLTGATITVTDAMTGQTDKTLELSEFQPSMSEAGIAVSGNTITIARTNYRPPFGEHLYEPPEGQKHLLSQYSMDGVLQKEYDISSISMTAYVQKLVLDDTTVYLLVEESSRKFVYRFDFQTEQLTKLDTPDVQDMALLAPGQLAFLVDSQETNTSAICVYDAATQTVLWEQDTQRRAFQMAVDTTTNICYLTYSSDVYVLLLRAAEAQEKNTADEPGAAHVYTFISRGHYYTVRPYSVLADNGTLVFFEAAGSLRVCENADGEWPKGTVIRVYTPYERMIVGPMLEAIVTMNERYPNFQMEMVTGNEPEYYYNNLVKKLLANDADFDLYFFTASDNMNMVQKGYFEDLSSSPTIVESVNAMLPGVKGLCMVNGKIYGYPEPMISTAQYDKTIMDFLGATPPDGPLTMDAYAQMMDGAADKMRENNFNIGSMDFLSLYANYTADFFAEPNPDISDLTALFTKSKNLLDKGLLQASNNSSQGVFTTSGYFSFHDDINLLAYPRVSEDGKYAVNATVLAVNPVAENKTLAVEFMEILMSKECHDRYYETSVNDDLEMHTHEGEDPATALIHVETEYSWSYLYERDPMHDSGNSNYTLYKQIIANSTYTQGGDTNLFARERFFRYAEGSMTLEAAVKDVFDKLLLMKNE